MTNGNDFASPSTHQNQDGTHDFNINKGLTKREYFAAMAMQGILANPDLIKTIASEFNEKECVKSLAEISIEHADALIKALNETT